jgi:hypothetical protein
LHVHFLVEFRGMRRSFGYRMRTISKEDAQGSYIHEEEFRGLHASMGNSKTKSNARRDRQEFVTMRILQREVKIYREYNENIMKVQEDMLHSLNMLQMKTIKTLAQIK